MFDVLGHIKLTYWSLCLFLSQGEDTEADTTTDTEVDEEVSSMSVIYNLLFIIY